MTDMFDELFGARNRWDAERDDDFGDGTEDEPDDPEWDDGLYDVEVDDA